MIPLPAGQNLTLVGGSSPRTVQTASGNPAAPVTTDLGGFWFGLSGFGVGYEVGDFANLVKQAQDLQDDVDQCDTACNEAQVETRTNTFIGTLNDEAVIKLFFSAQPPLLPMGGTLPGLGGAFTFGVSALSDAKVRILGTPNSAVVHDKSVTYDPNSSVQCAPGVSPCGRTSAGNDSCTGTDTNGCQFDADVGAYVKAVAGGVASLGYSGAVLHRMDGNLFVGGRLNYYDIEVDRAVVAVATSDNSNNDDNQQRIVDEFKDSKQTRTALGLDLGVLWAAYNFRAGATVRNVNEPKFDYNDIGQNCASLTPGTQERTDCDAAVRFSTSVPGAILLHDTYTMKRQAQLETAVYDSDRTLSLGFSYDVNAAPDATGDDYQWLGASASFSPRGWGFLVPALRAGYRENRAGSKLRMASAGLSLFRFLNLDAAMALDKVDNDGKSVPRSAMLNLSFELYF